MKWLILLTIFIIAVIYLFGLGSSSSLDPWCRNRLAFLDRKVQFIPRHINSSSRQGILVNGCLKTGTLKTKMHTVVGNKETGISGEVEGSSGSYQEIPSTNNDADNLNLLLSGLDTNDEVTIQLMIERKQALEFKD